MNSWKKVLFTLGLIALSTVSCKKSNNNNNLNFKEVSFSLSTHSTALSSEDYEIKLNIICDPNQHSLPQKQNISKSQSSFKIIDNNRCNISVEEIIIKINNTLTSFTPENKDFLRFEYKSTDATKLVNKEENKIYKNGNQEFFVNITNNSGSLSLILTSSKLLAEVQPNDTNISLAYPELNLVNVNSPLISGAFILERKIIGRPQDNIPSIVTIKKTDDSVINSEHCKVVSQRALRDYAKQLNKNHLSLEIVHRIYNDTNSAITKSCPQFNTENNWKDFASEEQYIIIAAPYNGAIYNSYTVAPIFKAL